MTYDALDRIIKQETPFDGVNTALTKQYYDKNSNVVKQMIKNNSPGAEETFQTTEYVYDSMGSVLGVIGRNSGQGQRSAVYLRHRKACHIYADGSDCLQ